MSATVEAPPPRARADAGHRAVVRAFREVSEAISDDTELDELLHLVARKICELVGTRRCSVYLHDPASGLYRGQVAETGGDDDRAIKRLTCGVEADAFTREVVATKAPVLIADVRRDPRPVRSTMQAWGVRSMLGVPMLLRQEAIGILFLDNAEEPHAFGDDDQDLAASFANLAAIAIAQARAAAELRATLQTVARQNGVLKRGAAMDDQLARLALDGGTLADIATAIAELTEKPCAIYDDGWQPLALGRPHGATPEPRGADAELRPGTPLVAAIEALPSDRPSVTDPFPEAGVSQRLLVAPVVVRGELWARVAVTETSRLTALDMIAAKRAATIVALEMAAERRVAAAHARARSSLVRDLIAGGDEPDALAARAASHGLDLTSAHVICTVTPRRPERLTGTEIEAVCAAQLPELVCGTTTELGAVLVVRLDAELPRRAAIARARSALEQALAGLAIRGGTTAGVSTACRRPSDYPRGYDESRQVLACLDRFADGLSPVEVLSADDLGAGRLFLSTAERADAERFAHDTLGGLLPAHGELLETLAAYFECARNVRQAAALLSVHENTVRYRLGRIAELTDLDVAGDVDDQLSAQIALLVLRFTRRATAAAAPAAAALTAP